MTTEAAHAVLQNQRFLIKPLAVLDDIGEVGDVGGLVVHGQYNGLGIEDLLNLAADIIVDGLNIELGVEPRDHIIDDGKLVGTLVDEVEQAGVLNGDGCLH